MAKKYIVANSLQPTDRQKVRQYIDIINNYEACLGAATLALRMMWELVFTYQDVKPDGEPIKKVIDDKKFVNKENTTPAEFETYLQISSCCHYREEHDLLTFDIRKSRFEYLVAKSKEAIMRRFKCYAKDSTSSEYDLMNGLINLFDRFSDRAAETWLDTEDVFEHSNDNSLSHLDKLCKEYDPETANIYSDIFYLRYIAEMVIHKKAKEINPDLGKTDYKDFVEVLRGNGKNKDRLLQLNAGERLILHDMANYAAAIGEVVNPRFHWYYTENNQADAEYTVQSDKRVLISARNRLASLLTSFTIDSQGLENVGTLINALNTGSRADSSLEHYVLERLNNEEQEHEKSKSIIENLKRKKKAYTWFFYSLIALVSICVVSVFLWRYSYPSDPNPRIRETIDSAASWLETPSVSVYIAGTEAEQNEALVLYANGEPTLIQVDAVCNGEYSLKYSQSERLANRYDYAVNPFGLSKLQYQLYSLGYDETTDMSMGRYSLPVGSGSASFNQELLPGWYCLSVQAVGAGDGITQSDNELVASTGWINYYILVLPADENVEWTLHNRSTNSYAAAKDGLSIQEGQSLVVNCDAMIQEGLKLYYAWDSGSWIKFESKTEIEVPSMKAGLHTLNLRACYAYNENIVVEAFTNSFSCMFEAPALPECNVELTVLAPDGTMVQDGSTIIVEPGDKISVSSYGRYGISKLEWYEEYQDGTMSESKAHESSSMTITLGGDYGEGTRTLYITVIGAGDGGLEDQMNRKQLSINLLYRTHEDEYDVNGNVTKDWLYDDASSNAPTGYSLYNITNEGDTTIETWAWYSMDDKPIYRINEGYHSWMKISSPNGYEAWVFDLDGTTPIENTNAFGKHADGAAGIIVEETENTYSCFYYGADRKLRSGLRGNAGYKQIQDEDGNILEDRVYDADINPVMNTDGWHFYKSKYENGYETESWFFDANGDPCDWTGGWHHAVYTYDPDGNQTSAIYYHADGSVVVNDGYSKYIKAFLPGTKIEESCEYRDEYDTPVMNTSLGYSRVVREYDNGELKSELFYDEGGNYVNCYDGYARIDYINKPLYKATLYKDSTGSLVIPNGQYWAKCEKFYDIDGNLTEIIYYSNETTHVGSPARTKYNYADGKKVTECYYDYKDDPMSLNGTNYCGMSYIYESSDDSTYYVYYLDENENRILNETGFYMSKKTEDGNGNVIMEERFLQDGSMPTGDAVRRIEWTFEGTMLTSEIEYSEPRVDVISKTVRKYDSNKSLSSIAYYDGNGSPVEDEYGVHKYTYTFVDSSETGTTSLQSEQLNKDTEITTFRAECLNDRDDLTIGPDGYAAIEVKYSEEKEPDYIMTREGFRVGEWWFGSESYLEVHYIGTNGKDMVNTKVGYAAYRKESSATQSVEEFYDQAGSLLYVENLGYAKLICDYENSNMTQWAFYGADGSLCLNSYGFAMEKWDYDENGYQISHSFHNTDESLMLNEYGTYALNESQYENGNRIYNAFKDADGKLMINPDYGYAICCKEWNGTDFETKYYDEHDGLIQSENATIDHSYPTDGIN